MDPKFFENITFSIRLKFIKDFENINIKKFNKN